MCICVIQYKMQYKITIVNKRFEMSKKNLNFPIILSNLISWDTTRYELPALLDTTKMLHSRY